MEESGQSQAPVALTPVVTQFRLSLLRGTYQRRFSTLRLDHANEEWGFYPAVTQTGSKLPMTQYPVINYCVSPLALKAVLKDMSATEPVKTEIYFKTSHYFFL